MHILFLAIVLIIMDFIFNVNPYVKRLEKESKERMKRTIEELEKH